MSDQSGTCLVCFEPASVRNQSDVFFVDCFRCGKFNVVGSGLGSQPGDPELFPYLSCHTRQASERGEVVTLNSVNWRPLAQAHRGTPFSKKVSMLLEFAAKDSGLELGGPSEINCGVDWPLVDVRSPDQLAYLIEHLENIGYLTPDGAPYFYKLQPKAWERLEAASIEQGIQGKCFVAMSFDGSLNDAYDNGIFLAVKADCNMIPVRLDREQHNENICDKIVAEIRTCQFLVADLLYVARTSILKPDSRWHWGGL